MGWLEFDAIINVLRKAQIDFASELTLKGKAFTYFDGFCLI